MLRIERAPGGTIVVSRLARPRVLAVLSVVLAVLALAVARSSLLAGLGLVAAAVLVAVLGGRSVRAHFEGGRVRVSQALRLHGKSVRPLADFAAARIETAGEARRRRAERLAEDWRARTGREMPSWMARSDAPGANDRLRRVVLVPRAGEPFAVTAWLGEEEDLERVRADIEMLLPGAK